MKVDVSQQVSSRVCWRKSSFSDDKGECVEVGETADAIVLVRDTKSRQAGTLAFTTTSWALFTQAAKTD